LLDFSGKKDKYEVEQLGLGIQMSRFERNAKGSPLRRRCKGRIVPKNVTGWRVDGDAAEDTNELSNEISSSTYY